MNRQIFATYQFLLIGFLLAGCAATPDKKAAAPADPRIEWAFQRIERTRSLAEYKAHVANAVVLMADRVDRDAVYVTVGEDKGSIVTTGQSYKVTPDGAVFLLDFASDEWKQQTDMIPTNP